MNAGKVWEVLHENQSLTQHQILKETGLTTDKFHQAVGWLSREDKIRKDGEFFSLSETNLTASIGSNAGVVITVLDDLTDSVESLEQLTKIQSDDFHQAVGWLAREGHFQQPSENQQEENTVISEPMSDDEQIQWLQAELDVLSDEVASRNHIINELTRQLTETQTKFIQDVDVIEKLNVQLAKSHHHISKVDEQNIEFEQKIHLLENEIGSLHTELHSRNHIINELSRQLTSTQTTIIEQADRLERLSMKMSGKPVASGTVSQSLRQRLKRITQLQRSLDTNQEPAIMTETKFYDNQSPVLDISQSQTVSEDELREALQELHQDIDDKLGHKKPQLHHDDQC